MKQVKLKKLNKKKIILIVSSMLIIVVALVILFVTRNEPTESNNEEEVTMAETKNQINEMDNEVSNIGQDTIGNAEVEELKKTTGVTGNSNIYEVQTEFEGQKILTVKKSVRFKTAFAGMIKKGLPQQSELDDILNKNYPSKKGIWIEENSRNKVLEIFNNGNSNKYDINNEGYLQIKNKTSQNEVDKKIEKAINGNKTIILDVSSVCYIIDDMTGNILDCNFEENDKYQSHEYFEDNNSLIIFITENKENQLDKSKILSNIVQLF